MKTFVLLLLVSVSGTVYAQSGNRFVITRSVVAGGGTTFSTSSRFQLGSTVAQPPAAVPSSARFSLQGGFWIQPAPVIFAPARVGSSFVFSFQTEPGKTYSVSASDSLNSPNWQTLTTIGGDGSVKTITNSAPGVTQRYYRLFEQ